MKKRLSTWIVNHYASTPDTGMGGRSYYFARELNRVGIPVTLICASFNHKLRTPKKLFKPVEFDNSNGFCVARVKVASYRYSFNKIRILNWFLFSLRFLNNFHLIKDKPKIIICSSPSLIAFLATWLVAKKYRAKLIFEFRDIWPLTLQKLGGFSRVNPLILALELVERFAYQSADLIVSNLSHAMAHVSKRGGGVKKFIWIPNGFDPDSYSEDRELPVLVESSLPKDGFIVGYTGALGTANALEFLITSASFLEAQGVKFVLVGQGRERNNLEKLASSLNLKNITFIDSVEKKYIPILLKKFDVCYQGCRNDPLYNFGVSPNKMADYLLSDRPILHSFSGKGDLVKISGSGITVPAEDSDQIAQAILQLKNISSFDREEMGRRGREFAEKNLSFRVLALEYQKCLMKLLDS